MRSSPRSCSARRAQGIDKYDAQLQRDQHVRNDVPKVGPAVGIYSVTPMIHRPYASDADVADLFLASLSPQSPVPTPPCPTVNRTAVV